jgi:hypothetical protein
MDIEMLKRRIQNLEAALSETTDLLEEMISEPTVGRLNILLSDAEEFIGENRAVLKGEFEE